MKSLLSTSAKTEKAKAFKVRQKVLFLMPGSWRCQDATPGCLRLCLRTSGLLALPASAQAQRWRTHLLETNPSEFVGRLCQELEAHERQSIKAGETPLVRLDGLSDLDWSPVYERFPGIRFVEYTKRPGKMERFLSGGFTPNVHFTFSRSEKNEMQALAFLARGGTVAVPFSTKRGEPLPSSWFGYPVIDGDLHDIRYMDEPSTVVGLRAKGKARKDTASGFVVDVR